MITVPKRVLTNVFFYITNQVPCIFYSIILVRCIILLIKYFVIKIKKSFHNLLISSMFLTE